VTSKVLLAGGCVLTLGARTPNHQQADVLIDGDVIAEIGTGLRARDAEQVDATGAWLDTALAFQTGFVAAIKTGDGLAAALFLLQLGSNKVSYGFQAGSNIFHVLLIEAWNVVTGISTKGF
jgi:hypothetical protein